MGIWVRFSDGSLYSVSTEETAQHLALQFEDVAIYFFATLVS